MLRPDECINGKAPALHPISVCETNFRKASMETLGGGLRTSRLTSRRAFAYPAQVGLVVLNQPPSKPMILDQETAC